MDVDLARRRPPDPGDLGLRPFGQAGEPLGVVGGREPPGPAAAWAGVSVGWS